ncbi:helix-turn-helix domain-containing protein [Paracoccus stylophorae]|uniref:Helix-turn-helix domain-containing protein n=1 Tax=Paracoccus stylophorae TaxID=659350 RepID=A0ABY7STT3_9RHOB|nr:helix-turn-helix domain-containing protein [Paracoccus stylophorae]WCR10456.1 helix-turn-helix domain-containing protein [Paracoccus stylophorae]
MHDSDRAEIRKLKPFRNMASPGFDALMQAAYVQEFPAQLCLVSQGMRASFLHVLVEGRVELFAEWNGQETTIDILKPVTSFILAACIRDGDHLMSARTLRACRIVLIPAVDMRAAFRRDVEFAVDVTEELARGYRSMVRRTKNLKLRSSRERLAAYLLALSDELGGAAGFTLPHEKRLIASYLGMTPESLSRCFKSLSRDGVHVAGARVTLTDRARLTAICRPDPQID